MKIMGLGWYIVVCSGDQQFWRIWWIQWRLWQFSRRPLEGTWWERDMMYLHCTPQSKRRWKYGKIWHEARMMWFTCDEIRWHSQWDDISQGGLDWKRQCDVMTILYTERDLMSARRLGKLNLLFDSTPILRLKGVTLGSEYFWDLDFKLLTMVTDLLKTWTSSSLSWNMVSGLCSNVSLTYLHQVPHYCCHLTGTSGSR